MSIFIVNAGAGAIAYDCKIEIRVTILCVPSIAPSNENTLIVQKGLNKKNIKL